MTVFRYVADKAKDGAYGLLLGLPFTVPTIAIGLIFGEDPKSALSFGALVEGVSAFSYMVEPEVSWFIKTTGDKLVDGIEYLDNFYSSINFKKIKL